MKTEVYKFVLPIWSLMAIEYPDEVELTKQEKEQLDFFLVNLIPNGVWDYSDERYWSAFNDITLYSKMDEVCDATYTVITND